MIPPRPVDFVVLLVGVVGLGVVKLGVVKLGVVKLGVVKLGVVGLDVGEVVGSEGSKSDLEG